MPFGKTQKMTKKMAKNSKKTDMLFVFKNKGVFLHFDHPGSAISVKLKVGIAFVSHFFGHFFDLPCEYAL